jgi:hypothetical protein
VGNYLLNHFGGDVAASVNECRLLGVTFVRMALQQKWTLKSRSFGSKLISTGWRFLPSEPQLSKHSGYNRIQAAPGARRASGLRFLAPLTAM